MHLCDVCDSKFKCKTSLNKHLSLKHGQLVSAKSNVGEVNFICSTCNERFSRKDCLKTHVSRKHGAMQNDVTNDANIFCEACSFGCVKYSELVQHYNKEHEVPAVVQNLSFPSVSEFDKWKVALEGETRAQFVVKSSKKLRDGSQRRYLRCNRTGRFCSEGKGERVPKAGVSNKTGGTCPAFINATCELNGTVSARACLYHFQHDSRLGVQRLSKNVKDQIESYLVVGISENEIIRKFANPNDSEKSLKRHHLLDKCDICNLKRQRRLDKYKRDENDWESITKWVLELQSNIDGDPILMFNRPTDDDPKYLLGIQFNQQLEWLKMFGTEAVCVDATHGTTGYGFYLVTLLVVDNYGEGLPVAWLVTNEETEAALTVFFDKLKERAGNICLNVFMSDDAPQYWNAFTAVFETTGCRKLLCIWHVFRAWKTQLQAKVESKERRDDILKFLRLLRLARFKRPFDKYLDQFSKSLTQFNEGDFKEYFLKKYCTEERLPQWAAWARQDSVVNTNMFVESYHRVLKDKYLAEDGKKKRQSFRIDRLISVLQQMFIDKVREQQSKREKGKVTHRLAELHKRHKASLSIPIGAIEFKGNNCWSVVASAGDLMYTVTRQQAECIRKCLRKCRLCQVCAHLYKYTCMDGVTQFTSACKHIHKVHSMQESKEVVDGARVDLDPCKEENPFLGIQLAPLQSRETVFMLDEIRLCAQKISMYPEALKRMLEQCRNIVTEYSESATPETNANRFPVVIQRTSKKNREIQRRFIIKLKNRLRTKTSCWRK